MPDAQWVFGTLAALLNLVLSAVWAGLYADTGDPLLLALAVVNFGMFLFVIIRSVDRG